MKKKVAHVCHTFFRYSENWIYTQLKHLQGFDTLVLANTTENLDTLGWKPEVFARRERVPALVKEVDSLALKIVGFYPSFYMKASRAGVGLIHAHFGPYGYISTVLARRLNIPLVTTFYGYDASLLPVQEPHWRKKYQKLFDYGSLFLVEGPAMGEKLVGLGCPHQKVRVHHLGIDPGEYPTRDEYRKEGPLRMIMAGRFVEKKGFMVGLQAFKSFLKGGGDGRLTIVGDGDERNGGGGLKQEMYEYVRQEGIESEVSFTGVVSLEDLKELYYKNDVFLAPSVEASNGDNEGGAPVTLIEAAATGIATIGSRHCDIPEVIIDEQTGLLVDERDYHQLADALFRLYSQRNLIEEFGRGGSKHIRERYNAPQLGQDLANIYRELLN